MGKNATITSFFASALLLTWSTAFALGYIPYSPSHTKSEIAQVSDQIYATDLAPPASIIVEGRSETEDSSPVPTPLNESEKKEESKEKDGDEDETNNEVLHRFELLLKAKTNIFGQWSSAFLAAKTSIPLYLLFHSWKVFLN